MAAVRCWRSRLGRGDCLRNGFLRSAGLFERPGRGGVGGVPQVEPTIGAVLDAPVSVGQILLLEGDEGLEGAGAGGVGGLGDVIDGGWVGEGDELGVDVDDGGDSPVDRSLIVVSGMKRASLPEGLEE
ncbi:hypothetical protein ACWC2T_43795 [Streptomyces sp. NPDC001393]